MSCASRGKRCENSAQPTNSSFTGISTSPVMASQKASQFWPYQSGKPNAVPKAEWSWPGSLIVLKSIVVRGNLVIFSPVVVLTLFHYYWEQFLFAKCS